jgi:hypothetical protein
VKALKVTSSTEPTSDCGLVQSSPLPTTVWGALCRNGDGQLIVENDVEKGTVDLQPTPAVIVDEA